MMSAPYPLDVVFCVPGLPFDGHTLKTKSLGGSESAGYYLARALAKRGHRVKMFSGTDKTEFTDGVEYRPLGGWQHFAQSATHDVSIVQRAPELFQNRLASKLNILWCHDLALKRSANVHKATSWNVDRVALLSRFMVEQYKEVIGTPDANIFQTRNGFDFDLQPKPIKPWAERDQKLILYCARPERGLDVLVRKVFPAMLAKDPDLKLGICSYANPTEMEQGEWYQQLMRDFEATPNAVNLGSLTKAELYDVMNSAALYVYPTPGEASPDFREVSCIAALEAQACGLPFVSTGLGALAETASESYFTDVDTLAEMATRLLESPAVWTDLQTRQLDHVASYAWDNIAAEWEAMFLDAIADRNADPTRLALWFYKRSEIDGAERALADVPDGANPLADDLKKKIAEKYYFRADEDIYAEHYRLLGGDTDADLTAKRNAGVFSKQWIETNPEPRFTVLRQMFREIEAEAPGSIQNLFDLGCGHGWSPIYLHNNLNIPVYGLDVDPGAIKWANTWADDFANSPADCHFTNDKLQALKQWPNQLNGGYDALVCSEVMEHVIDPKTFIEEGEKSVKKGGYVFLTVPFGPWEYGGPNWYTYRCHIREYSSADLHEIFGAKPGFTCGGIVNQNHPHLADPVGFYVVRYRADHEPLGDINWERKLKIQRPKQTLSINMIAGHNAEQTIAWSLESVTHLADEIIIGDTGLNTIAKDICEAYGAKIVPAPHPLNPSTGGFAASRNAVLDASSGEWVLWIDSDEKLIDAGGINQFLRENQFNGYTINQHHMTIDQPIPTDTPVRIFRTNRGIRFYGIVHEHPEAEMNKGPGVVCILTTAHIAHLGYANNNTRIQRFYRNRPLLMQDRRENPDRVLGIYLEARDNSTILQQLLNQTGGKVTDQMRQVARQTVELIRKYWALGIPLVGIDPLPFYSDALRILDEGFDCYLDIRIGRDGVGDKFDGGCRFATPEEMNAHIGRMTKDKVEAVTGRYF